MTASERERVEREARECVSEHCGAHPARLAAEIAAIILRERAAAFEEAADNAREALDDERKALNAGGYIEACMELERRCRALAAQERANA